MTCPALLEPACVAVHVIGPAAGSAVGSAATGVLHGIAAAIQSGIAWIVDNSVDWWIRIPSPDLGAEPAVGRLQQWMLPLTAVVAVLGLIIAGGKMALTRKANPLIDTASGLVIIGATSAVGVLLPSLLLQAGDAWSDWVLNASTDGHFASRLADLLALTGAQPTIVIVLGVVSIIISAVQAVLMLFRQASLIILAGVLPLAAAGTLNPATRIWFKKVTGWMLALIFYKPAAAAVYAAAFNMIGTGKDIRAIFMGFAMVLMSLLALPVLMRFFTWTTGQVADSARGGGFMQTALSGAVAIGALRGSAGGAGGSGAAEQARRVSAQLGPPDGGPQGAHASGAGVRQATRPTPVASPSSACATSTRAGSGGSSGLGHPFAAARSSAAAGTASAPAAAAGGPAGLAAGAATVRRKATETMQPPGEPGERRS